MMSTALDDQPGVDSGSGGPRGRRWIWVVAALVVLALAAAAALLIVRPWAGNSPEDVENDPSLAGEDKARSAVTTRTGVFVGTEPQTAQAYQQWLGAKLDYIVDFSPRDSWQDIADPAQMLQAWQGTGLRPVYSVAMLPEADDSATIEQGATGAYDQYFTQLAQNLVAADQANAILRLGWEFNLDSSRWQSDDPEAWVTYWRRIVAAMDAVPGAQFEYDWNPNNGDNPYDAVEYWPGDDIVDYVGVDAYDVGYQRNTYPYPDDCDDACRLERQTNAWNKGIYGGSRGLHFWSRFAAHHGKPMSLPEWGLWVRDDGHGGGWNTYYLEQMAAFVKDPANGVAYQAYFEFDGDDGPHRLTNDNFPGVGDEYRRLFVRS